ncbi:EcoKI restriction-modification system protein HsdS [Serratia fonticola]|uniref:restriction endonuclease subunit S n=1 Tax=Serratia fonticola TaxID=47917 RepID=UPI0021826921|nr:restriction endonuclease subunit S [Serratia fonticola]CAI2160174.1 EcoKI restriction-modification system protein HsdS [Serratia fonticola]
MGNKQLVTTKLVDLCELIVDCPHSTPEWTDSGYIVLRNQNIRNGSLDLSSPSFTDENGYKSRIKRAVPKAGDIVFTREAPMGEVCLIPEGLQCCLGQRQVLLRPKRGVSGEYLFWALQSPFVQHQISWNEGTGTTVSNIRIPVLKVFEIPRWFENERQIASHLSVIKNKINLNRQINQTLEQMAQTLFKSWFVDFDPVVDNALDAGFFEQDLEFSDELLRRAEARKAVRESSDFHPLPDHIRQLFPAAFEEWSEPSFGLGGWIPHGWVVSELNELIDIKHGFAFKGEYFSDKETDEVLLTPGNVGIGGGLKSEKYKFYAGPIEENYIFSSGDIFVTMTDLSKASDTLGYPAIVPEITKKRFHHNQRLGKVIYRGHPSSYPMFIYHTLCSASYRQSVLGSATGTTVKHTSPKKILSHKLVNSLNGLVEAEFERLVASYNLMASVNYKASMTLTRLRDTLLPKLISGELHLSDREVDTADEVLA